MENIKVEVEDIIRSAGKIFIESTISKETIYSKGPANYVTNIDYKVQEYLMEKLQDILPKSNIISEESENNSMKLDKYTWILDPVDGTTNLMYDYHHSAISLALYVEGQPNLAYVYNPTGDEMFFAEAGCGTKLNGIPVKASKNKELKDSLIGFGTTPYDKSKTEMTFELVKKIFAECRDIRRSGSAALDLAYIACGRLDGFFEYTLQPWDYAAGLLLVKEAGGVVTDCYGKDLGVITPSSTLAANPYIYEKLLNMVRGGIYLG